MTLVLDTSVVIELAKGDGDTISKLEKLRQKRPGKLCITSPTYSETYYGCLNKSEKARRSMLDYLNSFELMNTNRQSSIILAHLREQSHETGNKIPPMDLLIASIVLAGKGTLVTKDRHFSFVRALDSVLL